MTDAKRDNNSVTTIVGLLNTNGTTVTPVKVDAATHQLEVSDGSTGSDSGPTRALRDANMVTTLTAVSNDGNATIVPLYVDSSGNLLVKST